MILMIDNYDSFTYNLVQYLGELGADVTVQVLAAVDFPALKREAGQWYNAVPPLCRPGQQWLGFTSVWYQLPAFNAPDDQTDGFTRTLTDNADVIIAAILVVLLFTFALTPWIPVLRDLPRWIPLHRLVWKQYYREHGRAS